MVFWASIYKRVTHVTSHKLEISSERKRSRVNVSCYGNTSKTYKTINPAKHRKTENTCVECLELLLDEKIQIDFDLVQRFCKAPSIQMFSVNSCFDPVMFLFAFWSGTSAQKCDVSSEHPITWNKSKHWSLFRWRSIYHYKEHELFENI